MATEGKDESLTIGAILVVGVLLYFYLTRQNALLAPAPTTSICGQLVGVGAGVATAVASKNPNAGVAVGTATSNSGLGDKICDLGEKVAAVPKDLLKHPGDLVVNPFNYGGDWNGDSSDASGLTAAEKIKLAGEAHKAGYKTAKEYMEAYKTTAAGKRASVFGSTVGAVFDKIGKV